MVREFEVWQGLANLYSSLSYWKDAEICLEKARVLKPYSAAILHIEGRDQTFQLCCSFCYGLLFFWYCWTNRKLLIYPWLTIWMFMFILCKRLLSSKMDVLSYKDSSKKILHQKGGNLKFLLCSTLLNNFSTLNRGVGNLWSTCLHSHACPHTLHYSILRLPTPPSCEFCN